MNCDRPGAARKAEEPPLTQLAHPLDRPVWSALSTRQAGFSRGDARALRFAPEIAPMAAPAEDSPDSLAALAALITPGGEIWRVEAGEPPAPPPGCVVARTAVLWQMAAAAITPGGPEVGIVALDESDAAEMLALATLTKPGPYRARTHELGDFIGVREGGRLVAMAGERMKPEGFAEVSAVCTHPDHRGRGYAGALMRQVAARMLARGETPFLHAYASNTGAIGLYEALGFRLRREMVMTVLVREGERA